METKFKVTYSFVVTPEVGEKLKSNYDVHKYIVENNLRCDVKREDLYEKEELKEIIHDLEDKFRELWKKKGCQGLLEVECSFEFDGDEYYAWRDMNNILINVNDYGDITINYVIENSMGYKDLFKDEPIGNEPCYIQREILECAISELED